VGVGLVLVSVGQGRMLCPSTPHFKKQRVADATMIPKTNENCEGKILYRRDIIISWVGVDFLRKEPIAPAEGMTPELKSAKQLLMLQLLIKSKVLNWSGAVSRL